MTVNSHPGDGFTGAAVVRATATARARLDELADLRGALEHEQQGGPTTQRAFEINNQLTRLGGEEQMLKWRIYHSEHTASSVDLMQLLQGLDAALSETSNWMRRDLAHMLLAVERRRHQRNAWYRWIYGAVLAGYAVLVVAVGVSLDAVLAVTPIAGIVTSLAAAFMLAIVDRAKIRLIQIPAANHAYPSTGDRGRRRCLSARPESA
jgi:hypothetical protein